VCVRPQSTCIRTHITARAGCAACDRGVALRATVVPRATCCVRPWCCMLRASMVLHAACVSAFERTKCGRTHSGKIFTLSPLSCPLLAMFVAMTCTTQNTKNYTKILVINATKSLTNISKGGSNNQYLTPIKYPQTYILLVP
jgi:hypothetical protein